jgi:hypothetical protein
MLRAARSTAKSCQVARRLYASRALAARVDLVALVRCSAARRSAVARATAVVAWAVWASSDRSCVMSDASFLERSSIRAPMPATRLRWSLSFFVVDGGLGGLVGEGPAASAPGWSPIEHARTRRSATVRRVMLLARPRLPARPGSGGSRGARPGRH